jgi:hypothetical protein
MSRLYRFFSNMSWPAPGPDLSDVQRTLLFGQPTKNDLAMAASVINAYTELVNCTHKKRNMVISQLRLGPGKESEPTL